MRKLLLALIAAACVLGVVVAPVHAQEDSGLEDVVLQGRILLPDGSPASNIAVRVDTHESQAFGFFAFFFTGGLSLLGCFAGDDELCPGGGGGSAFHTTTDSAGHYSFTFKDAKYPGEQTDTDYILSAGVRSTTNPNSAVVGSYELELLDAVHNAPDLKLWDPSIKVEPRVGGYGVSYTLRPQSNNSANLSLNDKGASQLLRDGFINARDVEDSVFKVSPSASKDVYSAGTIYHQRFAGGSVARRGTLVPLSRGAACTAVRIDGVRETCTATDGDLTTPSVKSNNPCAFWDEEDRAAGKPVDCDGKVVEITIDMGTPKKVGEIRRTGGSDLSGSADGARWVTLPTSGLLNSPRSLRYIRVTSKADVLGSIPEISVWGPSKDVEAIEPLSPTTVPTITPLDDDGKSAKGADRTNDDDDLHTPWMEILATFTIITIVAVLLRKREQI